jgi:hypothetical protein
VKQLKLLPQIVYMFENNLSCVCVCVCKRVGRCAAYVLEAIIPSQWQHHKFFVNDEDNKHQLHEFYHMPLISLVFLLLVPLLLLFGFRVTCHLESETSGIIDNKREGAGKVNIRLRFNFYA